MAKNYNPSVGDIIIKSFINEFGKKVSRHPFVIVSVKDDLITALDERAIFGGFAVSDYKSTKSKSITEELEDFGILNVTKEDGFKKESIVQVNSLTLFAKDVIPVDKQGEVNPEVVKRALNLLNRLKQAGKLSINKNNLPRVIIEREETKEQKR